MYKKKRRYHNRVEFHLLVFIVRYRYRFVADKERHPPQVEEHVSSTSMFELKMSGLLIGTMV